MRITIDDEDEYPYARKAAGHGCTPVCLPGGGRLLCQPLHGNPTDQTPGWHPHEYGCLVLALDIAGFTDTDAFKHAVSDMCRHLRNETPADGVDRVAVPGDRGHEKLKTARKAGKIQIEDTIIDALNRLNPQDRVIPTISLT